MKKNSVLVKSMFMNILTAGIFGLVFTACSDDEVMNGIEQAQMAAENLKQAGELKNLLNAEYSFPFEVKNNGQWRIGFGYDEDGQICYAYPKSGNGNATVKIYVSKNNTCNERTNEMYIINTLSGDTLKTMTITQQAGAATRADVAETGNRIYGAGYGYNIVTGKMSQAPLVMTSAAIDEKVLVTGGVEKKQLEVLSFQFFVYLCTIIITNSMQNSLSARLTYRIMAVVLVMMLSLPVWCMSLSESRCSWRPRDAI